MLGISFKGGSLHVDNFLPVELLKAALKNYPEEGSGPAFFDWLTGPEVKTVYVDRFKPGLFLGRAAIWPGTGPS